MHVILTCINNFQEYILINIEQLLKLNYKSIYVITNYFFFEKFNKYDGLINLINIDDIIDSYNFYSNTTLDKEIRGGFWALTSLRLFYIYSFMEKNDLRDVIHLENDVLLYYNFNIISNKINDKKMYIPFDSFNRNILSVVYIPSSDIFKDILDLYDFTKNDMENFKHIKDSCNLIDQFPIFNNDDGIYNDEISFVSKNFNNFNYIFDAAAIGQYLGGIDPENSSENTVNFVNETCVIKYNLYEFFWRSLDNIMKPFVKINNEIIPIFNLHVNCKDLYKFINVKQFDIVIPLGPNEVNNINKQLEHTKTNVCGYRNIYIVSYDPTITIDGCITIDENSFLIDKNFIEKYFAEYNGKNNKNGWYIQQLLKLYSGDCIPGILDDYLVIDADVFFLNPIKFIDNDKYIFTIGNEYHEPYFKHMQRLSFNLTKCHEKSGISHHMIFNKKIVRELLKHVEKLHNNKPFWEIFITMVDEHKFYPISYTESGASEYEIYFNYMIKYNFDKIIIRELKWENISINSYNTDCYDKTNSFVSVAWHVA
jgi:hypothetical protein